mmetsp:Transcript_43940/g.42498  ORF Transcript_43940/g.42498 Transcript_43940/m.42498 type:complete len:146 (+) Transcript_43940:1528-1965(+)|eukprot:CAMPEP_0170553508 /NCGR_PEP_ID=MMETSP0211-20121228/11338_1 /TAXON_ID=311385 /ORGANISM="Pseudokeronopsis sp., Strain OXSARD2" /LENGTH=145 /DNA_ID=CAMNT_0010861895 /DNA_START=1466 /DNA_END=1903 /DNA_ORIENTATION=+
MGPPEQESRILEDLNILYRKCSKAGDKFDIRDYYIQNSFVNQEWTQMSGTGLALFDTDQTQLLAPLYNGVDDKLFFAGEYLSAHHDWILGAIQAASSSMSQLYGKQVHNTFLFPPSWIGKKDANGIEYKPLNIENIDFKFDVPAQ